MAEIVCHIEGILYVRQRLTEIREEFAQLCLA